MRLFSCFRLVVFARFQCAAESLLKVSLVVMLCFTQSDLPAEEDTSNEEALRQCVTEKVFQFGIALQHQRFEEARSQFKKLMLLNEEANGEIQASPKFPVSTAAMGYGELQVIRLGRDRPELGKVLGTPAAFEIKNWLIGAFAGRHTSFRIKWSNAALPASLAQYDSACKDPKPGDIAEIRVASHHSYANGHKTVSADFVLSCVVFELCNLQKATSRDRLDALAVRGQISRDEFIAEACRTEFEAEQLTRVVFANHILPNVDELGLKVVAENWAISLDRMILPKKIEQRFPRSNDYPWGVFGRQFDALTRSVIQK